jgi:undecaprenyl-diphosphatase
VWGYNPGMRRWTALARHELIPLILLVLIAGGIWLFAELAEEVGEGETEAVDRAILLALREPDDLSDPLGPAWLEESGRDFTALGSIGVLAMLTLAVSGFLALDGKRRAALLVLAAVAGGLLGSHLLKGAFERPRPDLVPHRAVVYTHSFPSGHSMLSASTYLTLGALLARVQKRRRLKAFILVLTAFLTLLVGFSRIYLGVHWPSDVLAGWTAGGVWAFLCWLVALRLQKQGAIENPDEHGPDGSPFPN